MTKTLFVGNLPFSVTEDSLRILFQTAGAVRSVRLIRDRETQQTRGFAFVEFESAREADVAIAEFSGRRLDGRELVVNEARPREPFARSAASR